MTQASYGKILRLQLTPMQLPQAVPLKSSEGARGIAVAGGAMATDTSFAGCQILVHPGEPSEMVVQLQNQGASPLQVDIQMQGNFPAEWCRIGMEGHEIAPGEQMEAVLYFLLPANFFEEQESLGPGESLVADYQTGIHVYYTAQGTGRQQIEFAAFNVYIRPRSLYLNFLPAIYRQVDFVGRFLKIFEQAFEPAVDTLDVLWAHLDPLTAPEALLPFLAHWVAWPLDPRLSLERQRRLISHAIQIYRWRGTRRGLRLYLHLATDLPLDDHISQEADKHISITETFGEGFVIGSSRIGREAIIGGGRAYHFIIHLRPDPGIEIDEQLVVGILDREKPLWCTYELYIETG